MRQFKLPDLGEGLAEAEIVQWHVQVGDEIKRDEPLVAVETDKAVVEVPSPVSGTVARIVGAAGDIIHTGDVLAEFDGDQPGASKTAATDPGTVVGEIKSGQQVVREEASGVRPGTAANIKATPAVRALARRHGVDLDVVTPSGPEGLITTADVERVAKILREVGPLEPLHGARRVMARAMAQAHAEVVAVTVTEEADIDAWVNPGDVTLRLVRAIVAGIQVEPSLNAWYDGHAIGRRVLEKIELGIAVDTPDGLFVPTLRNVGKRTNEDLRNGLKALRAAVADRSIPPEELRGQTITLSNFGTICGRHATPIVLPPTVAIR